MYTHHKLYRRVLLTIGMVLLLATSITGSALAISVLGDDTITVGENEVIDDDLVLAGNIVIVDGVINGDLIAVGNQVTINGEVKGSLVVAGQSLALNGAVGGTVYSGGASLTLGPNAIVSRNVIFGGYSYRTETGSTIGRDGAIAGYQAILHGEVARNLYGSLAALELNGVVGGNVEAFVDQPGGTEIAFMPIFAAQELPPAVQPGLRVGPDAKVRGRFSYVSPVEQSGAIAIQPEGGIVYSMPQPGAAGTPAVTVPPTPTKQTLEWFWARLRELSSLLVIGALALWLMPTIFSQISERAQAQALVAGAWGFLVALLGYGGAVLFTILLILAIAALSAFALAGLATSVVGIGFSSLGLVFSLFSTLVAYGSKLVVVYPLSHTLLARFLPQWNQYRIVPLFLGALTFVLLSSIPFVGVLISIGVTLVGLGAMWLVFRDRFSRTKAAAPELVPAPA